MSESDQTLLEQAQSQLRRGQPGAAVRTFTRVIDEEGASLEAYSGRAAALQASGNGEGALGDLQEAINLSPNDADLWYRRGMLLLSMQDVQGAVKDLNQSINIDQGNAKAYNGRAMAYVQFQQFEDAIADLDRAVKVDNNDASLYYFRGGVLRQLKRHRESVEDLTRAIAMRPEHPPSYDERCQSYLAMKRIEKAEADVRKAMSFEDSPHRAFYLGQCLLAKDDMSAALQLFERAVKGNVGADAYAERGWVYVKMNNMERGESDLRTATQHNPQHPRAWYYRAHYQFEQSRPKEAIEDINKAVEITPDDPEVYRLRLKINQKLGDNAEAREDLKKLLEHADSTPERLRLESELKKLERADDGKSKKSKGKLDFKDRKVQIGAGVLAVVIIAVVVVVFVL